MRAAKIIVGLLAVGGIAALSGLFVWNRATEQSKLEVTELTRDVTSTKRALLGFTRYTDYLAAGQQSLAEQTKLLTATVKRTYRMARKVERVTLDTTVSTGVVVIEYDVEYSFGYDLRSEKYSVRGTPAGIEIRLPRPTLVSPPAVTNLRQEVLAKGWITNEEKTNSRGL